MSTSSSIGISTMKPRCTILIGYKSSSFFCVSIPKFDHSVFENLSTFRSKVVHKRQYRGCNNHIDRCVGVIDLNRTDFNVSYSYWGQIRVFPTSSRRISSILGVNTSSRSVSKRGLLVIPKVASDYRNHSTSVEAHANEKIFENIYIQGALNLKPLAINRIETGPSDVVKKEESRVEVIGTNATVDNVKGLNEPEIKRKESDIEKEAWQLLHNVVVNYCGNPVGTVAANDPADKQPLNYDQVFIRDFVPSALAFLLNGEVEIVKNFLLHTLQLQSWEKTVDYYSPGQGLMPASFKVRTVPLDASNDAFEEILDPDFGESAIGRVAPVDSGLWWIILLRAYGKITGDYALQERMDVQTGIGLILKQCLTDGFDMFPTLLVTDGSCMIDRRMGIHGHPLEIQALFYSALRCSREMLIVNDSTKSLVAAINNRLSALSFHIREYYWVDTEKINEIYRYKTEEYSTDATNKFNIYPDQIPSWLVDWIPEQGGYLIGNLQPAHMDFRFFTLGNLWAIVSSLGSRKQNESILNLIEAKWDDLLAQMPLKICYPALESEEWRIITGGDPRNTPWSYHNGGSWPTLLWQFTLACIKLGRPELAQKAIDLVENRLPLDQWPEYYDTIFFFTLACIKLGRPELAQKAIDLVENRLPLDQWPEYYDTKSGRFIGKQSRLYQTWTIAGYLASKMLLKNPEKASMLFWEEDYELLETCVCALGKHGRTKCTPLTARS